MFLYLLDMKNIIKLYHKNDMEEKPVIIKASAALRKDYSKISKMAHESREPIYITKNEEGDMVLMSIDVFER